MLFWFVFFTSHEYIIRTCGRIAHVLIKQGNTCSKLWLRTLLNMLNVALNVLKVHKSYIRMTSLYIICYWFSYWFGTCFFFAGYVMSENLPAGIYLFKVNNGNSRTISEVCSKLTIKTPCFHCWLWTSKYGLGTGFR